MGKKIENSLLTWILVAVIVLYPLMWIYKKIGGVGLIICGVIFIIILLCYKAGNSKNKQKEFDELVLYVLHNRMTPTDAKNLNAKLYQNNFQKGALIRNLQIIRDSIDIALSSKKQDIALSRMNSVFERYRDIKENQINLISESVFEEITRVVRETKNNFDKYFYINSAKGNIDKSRKLKTKKSKLKYLDIAEGILKEGISRNNENNSELLEVLQEVKLAKDLLEWN